MGLAWRVAAQLAGWRAGLVGELARMESSSLGGQRNQVSSGRSQRAVFLIMYPKLSVATLITSGRPRGLCG